MTSGPRSPRRAPGRLSRTWRLTTPRETASREPPHTRLAAGNSERVSAAKTSLKATSQATGVTMKPIWDLAMAIMMSTTLVAALEAQTQAGAQKTDTTVRGAAIVAHGTST